VEPADVTYLETHGTGTQLGDPIELNALGEVFAGRTSPLLVGSVKANIGHLEEAAGLAGVIKAVLMLRHRMIPRQIHCDVLSDNVDWADLPLEVPRTLMQWPDAPAIAAVSSFGMSGTNAHVVLEAFDVPPASRSVQRRSFVFPLSARDEEDLDAMVRQLVDGLSADHDVAEVAYTLQIGRKRHRCRLAVVASDMQALRTLLQAVLNGAAVGSEVVRGDGAGEVEGRPLATEAALQLLADEELATLATLWCEGYVVDWSALCGATIPRRVPLPTYPFKRERVWLTSRESIKAKVPSPPEADASERRQNGHPEVAAATATQLAASSGSASGRDASASPPQGEPVASSNGRDSGAPALPAVPGAAPQPVSHPASAVIDALRAHLAELFGTVPDGLSLDAPFDELGADSLTFMRVSQFVRDRFHVTLSFQQLIEDASTLQELAAIVSSKMPASAPDWSPEPAPSTKAAPSTKSEPAFRSGPSSLGMSGHQTEGLTEQQARFLAELIDAYTARTAGSKAEAERDRSVMANCRTLPFQSLCKEMTYPIVVDRSAGSRFWDIDGNEYLDISIGYGVHFFGHQPDFIVDALREQLEKGVHIGPQASQSGNVARLLCELTGLSRAVFCSSGTEAVMASLRFARAATGRTRFVMFEGSYHGWSDPTLALPAGPRGSIPMARGIGAGAMSDVVVLEYGALESLETIRALAPELAAVLVEPVQSRRPDLQPVEFLRELRQITRAAGAALVFDEIITGFRIHPGGAQAWAGVDADLVVYGKILGGGMPIGAIAGRPEFMDTVDGGAWSYGDDSSPTVPTTFFGGTFNRNPMSMAAAQAVLTRLKAEGPQLQQRLGDTVTALADEFNAFCREEDFPLQVVHFASLFRFIGEGDYSLQRFPIPIDLFFYMLALQGIYVLESRVCFLSVSHTADDVQHIVETAKSCLRALRAGGFFPTSKAALPPAIPVGNRLAEDARLDAAFSVPALRAVGPPDDVLLTGGTGFLGAHLAAELLRATPARVHCVARADDAEQAKNRVIGNLEANGCWDNAFAARIVGIPGDLARPGLGLADTTWRELAETIDAIYHNGAHVHSLLSYDKLRAPNVEGTHELLRLAVDGTVKAFHYISTDAVFDAHGYLRQARIYEDEPLTHADTLYGGGYAETKWVADNLVAHARAAGLHASIYRPGTVTGALAGGCGQVGDYFTRFIRGSIQLGICPDIDATIDLVPVDVVAQSIVALSQAKNGPGTFHLAHPEPIGYGQLVQAIRDAGYPLEIVPLHVWEAALADLRYEDDNALYPLLPLFLESSDPIFRRARLDARNTVASATAFRKTCPPLVDLIPTYLKRFRAEGLLELRGREPVAR
ncbi:MAG: thioester reductase domain-containing protein, partial [Actinomycetota bacterium]|nr:thioester reductase domain-containing protein [Actinomycetota bacterium]